MVIRRIIGKKGRTTIPLPIRSILEIRDHDCISFELNDERTIITIKRETNSDRDEMNNPEITEKDIADFIDSLSPKMQETIFISLCDKIVNSPNPQMGNVRRILI